jgi:methyl-accepting chemotaxis protein
MAKFKRRKRNYLINKDLQGKLGLQYLLLTVASIGLFGVLFAFASSGNLTISYENQGIEVGSTPLVLLGEMLRSQGLFLLFGGLLVILITIVLTHRIAGPIYRFEQTFKSMTQRQLNQKIHLRKGDEAKELGNLINQFNQQLSDDLTRLKEQASRLKESEEKVEILKILELYHLVENNPAND